MRVLILGDVMGRPARRAVRELVPALIKKEAVDLAIANAENSAGGMGVDIKSAGLTQAPRSGSEHLLAS